MEDKEPKYIEGVGYRYEVEHSMHRRMQNHDYTGRCIYMITICTEGRLPLLGELAWDSEDASDAAVIPTELGKEVIRYWYGIKDFYPEVEPLVIQLMPDHIHGLLFVKREMETHLGKVIKGFKIGCSKAWWKICEEDTHNLDSTAGLTNMSSSSNYNSTNRTPPKRPSLFEAGYQDSVLKGKNQLEHMNRYIADNPRRLAIKRMRPDLFHIVSETTINGRNYAAIGNLRLLDSPVRMQVRCHNNTTQQNLLLIEKQKAYFLNRAKEGGGKLFEACAKGLLLMLAPWPYHMEKRKISRTQCLELNNMAQEISTEPWTESLEQDLLNSE